MVDLDTRWEEREQARLRLARLRAGDGGSLDKALDRALRISATTLDVARVGIWLFTDSGTELRCTLLVDRGDPTEQPGAVFRIPDIAAYHREIDLHRVIAIEDVETSPLLRAVVPEYYAPRGLSSTLDAPMYRDGRIVGVVCHEHRGAPRSWSDSDAEFAISIAEVAAHLMTAAALQEAERSLQESETRVREALATEALMRVARGVAHDLNNILAVIVATGDLMRRDPRPESITRGLEAIHGVAMSGSRLAQRLMTFGRKHQGTVRKLPVDATTNDLMPVLTSVAGAQRVLSFQPGAGSASILIDPAFLEQLLLNLVVNAKEATAQGGHISISTSIRELPAPDGGLGDFVVLEVVDDGRGMDAQTLARCFEPFFSTKSEPREAGFGLATVQGIVGAVGGFVTATSEPGRGATFSVALPLAR